jgi:hypothetical protein
MGDLNMPSIDWGGLTSNHPMEQDFCDVLDKFNLIQVNTEPSRRSNDNILDVVICNKPNNITQLTCMESSLKSDHLEINFRYSCNRVKSIHKDSVNSNKKIYLYNNANYDEINYHLSKLKLSDTVWLHKDNLDKAWYKWKNSVLSIIEQYVPCKNFNPKTTSPWLDGEVIHMSNLKETARRKAKKSGKVNDWSNYKDLNNRIKKLVHAKYSAYINDCFEELDCNPKKFWKLASNKSNKKGALPHEMSYNDVKANTAAGKATLFNEFFNDQFNKKLFDVNNLGLNTFINNNLGSITVSQADVLEVLLNLNVNKAYGPDGMSPIFLKNCAEIITPSLTILFNLSLDHGYFPQDWKQANVVPIFKKGQDNLVSNYRPISLLSVISKVLERLVHNHIYPITRGDIHDHQHGFMSHKSTSTQLIEFYNNIYKQLDNKTQCDVIYLDLAKAFDSVPHTLLLKKLETFGFNNKLLSWFNSYLSNRLQRVVVEGKTSSYIIVKSGVPQGSILGPLMFNYFINDIIQCTHNSNCDIFLYADDSKIVKDIKSYNDCLILQNCLENLNRWCEKWGLKFNVTKCAIMTFARTKQPYTYDYHLDGLILNRVTSFTDLGVIVNNRLSWDNHITMSVNKAFKRLGYIKRVIGHDCNIESKLLCYKSLVRPIVEFNSCVWTCGTKKLLLKIESLQRRASKYILDDYVSNYYTRITKCNILPLAMRRDFLDCVFMYNYHNQVVDVNLDVNFHRDGEQPVRLRNQPDNLTLIPRINHLQSYSKFFCNRIVKIWNCIPLEIRSVELGDGDNNNSFKKQLKEWLFKKFHHDFCSDNPCTWSVKCQCQRCGVI